jgi:hypothetical protein
LLMHGPQSTFQQAAGVADVQAPGPATGREQGSRGARWCVSGQIARSNPLR